jgi:acyl carrier protein
MAKLEKLLLPVAASAGGDDVDVKAKLVSIWREVLKVDQLDTRQPFLDLGGTSISAIQVMARVQERLGVSLTIIRLFDVSDSSVDAIAGYIELVHWGMPEESADAAEDMSELRLS